MASFKERLAKLSPEKRELFEYYLRKEQATSDLYEEPLPGVEQQLATIFGDILNLSAIGRQQDLFELGADSISIIQVVARAQSQGIAISVHDVFQNSSLARLGQVAIPTPSNVATGDPASASFEPGDREGGVEDVYPLTPAQEGILYHCLLPGAPRYHVQWSLEVVGELDVDAFRVAWSEAIDGHAALRTAIRWVGRSDPAQIVLRRVSYDFLFQDISALADTERSAYLRRVRHDDSQSPFDLTRAPLARIKILKIAPKLHHFVWTHHHIVLDGWSQQVLLRKMAASYLHHTKRSMSASGSEPLYRKYVEWVLDRDIEEQKRFWTKLLRDYVVPAPEPVFGPSEATAQSSEQLAGPGLEVRTIEDPATAELQRFARLHRVTLSVLVQCAWAVAWHHLTGRDRVTFGMTMSGRSANIPGISDMVGLLINSIPVPVSFARGQSVIEWIQELMCKQAELIEHEATPASRIREYVGCKPGVPLFEGILVFESLPEGSDDAWRAAGLALTRHDVTVDEGYPVVLVVQPVPRLCLELKYDPRRVPRHRALSLIALIDNVLSDLPKCDPADALDGFLERQYARLREVRADARRARRGASPKNPPR